MSLPSDERFTPTYVLDLVREFAPIVLDPCCGPLAPRGHATHYYDGIEYDGLERSWGDGLVFVNPPYSRGQLTRWVKHALLQVELGSSEVIMLLPADLGTQWGTEVFRSAQALAFWRGRIAFGTPDDPSGMESAAKQPSLLAYWGERSERFRRVFSGRANVIIRGWG